MDLRGLANAYTRTVNPNVVAQYLRSTGYTTAADGRRTPSFAPAVDLTVQVQAMSADDLKQVSGLNVQGEKRAMYITGDVAAVSRPDGRGGDLLTLPDGSHWLVTLPLEDWKPSAGWVKVCCVRQMAPGA